MQNTPMNHMLSSMFALHDNLDDTLDVLCPTLDDLTIMVEDIFVYDTRLRLGDETIDDDDNSNTIG